MRETLWNRPRPTIEHYRWLGNLLTLHALTKAWLKSLNADRPTPVGYQLPRVLSADMKRSLKQLESFSSVSLHFALETAPDYSSLDETLRRYEHTVWAIQAWTLEDVFSQTPDEEKQALKSLLAQTSWKQGRETAQKRWPSLPETARQDARGIFSAFKDSPFGGEGGRRPYLVRRALPRALDLEMLGCPHENELVAILPRADELCELHTHWMRGYAYALNTKLVIDSEPRRPADGVAHCSMRWTLVE